jgi:OMF family outer membrane factor
MALLPSLNARFDLRHYRDPDTGEGERRFLLGVSASLPVWDGLSRLQGRRAARARAEEAEARAEQLRRDLAIEVLDARGEASLALDRREAARLARASSEEALRLAIARYRAGLLSQTDLLAADAEAARARLAAVDADVEAVLAQYRYRHAMGALE